LSKAARAGTAPLAQRIAWCSDVLSLKFQKSLKFRSMIQVNTNVIITLQALVKMEVTEIWLQTDRGMSFNSCGTSLESANRRSVFVASF
jgi:hypothetical protein